MMYRLFDKTRMRRIPSILKFVVFILCAFTFLWSCYSRKNEGVHFKNMDFTTNDKRTNDSVKISLRPYGQLLGDWECRLYTMTNGNWVKDTAYWSFNPILDGTAVQDFWWNPANKSQDKGKDFHGTNIRMLNPDTKKWSVVWVENEGNSIQGPWISYENDNNEILVKDSTETWQIRFYDIDTEKFLWDWKFLKDSIWEIRVKIEAVRCGSGQKFKLD